MAKARALLLFAIAFVLLAAGPAHGIFVPREVDVIPVQSAPGAIGESSALGRLYVGNTGSGTVSIIDEASRKVIGTTSVGPAPHGIAVNNSSGRVYVAIGESNYVAVLNAASGAVIANFVIPQCTGPTGPWGIAVHPATGVVYVACYSAGRLVALNGTSGAILGSVTTAGGPLGVAVDPGQNLVYLGHFGSPEIRVLDAATLATTSRITKDVDVQTWGIAVDPVTHRLFVANFLRGTVSAFLNGKRIMFAAGLAGPEWISVDSSRDRVWVPEFNAIHRVSAVDGTTGIVFPVAISGSNPTATAVNPMGVAYSTNMQSLNVSVIVG
jgi:YVTN family beta-propeller protein